MAHLVSVMGVSGSGKSSSILPNVQNGIKGLDPNETFIINISGKPLPAKGSNKLYPLNIKPSEGGRHVEVSKPEQIVQIMRYATCQVGDQLHFLGLGEQIVGLLEQSLGVVVTGLERHDI